MGKTVGLFGLTFDSGNMGCQAIAYSFYNFISEYDVEKIYCFCEGGIDKKYIHEDVDMATVVYKIKDPKSVINMKKYLEKCDLIFDFTEGDSFSDIYGIKRFIRISIPKLLSARYGKTFILGPQTYGPYYSVLARMLSKRIFQKSDLVMSRDAASAELVKSMSGVTAKVFTDVAFALPYTKGEVSNQKKIGINVSGLLWNGGYTGTNQFGLKVDYKEYISSLIKKLLDSGFEVHLIPHVITKNDKNVENDVSANEELKRIFPEIITAPSFTNPVEAKNYISSMNIFIGARMHATIGAFSSGVITIPFSYSKKFEGLFGNLDYPYVIDARRLETKEATDKTIEYIKNQNILLFSQIQAMQKIQAILDDFKCQLDGLFKGESKC